LDTIIEAHREKIRCGKESLSKFAYEDKVILASNITCTQLYAAIRHFLLKTKPMIH